VFFYSKYKHIIAKLISLHCQKLFFFKYSPRRKMFQTKLAGISEAVFMSPNSFHFCTMGCF
jgi:hypothetical protein